MQIHWNGPASAKRNAGHTLFKRLATLFAQHGADHEIYATKLSEFKCIHDAVALCVRPACAYDQLDIDTKKINTKKTDLKRRRLA